MALVDVTEVLIDPDFSSDFTLVRTTGQWEKGRFILDAPIEIPCYGPVQPPTPKELELLPEGERKRAYMCFHVKGQDVYLTRDLEGDKKGGISDHFIWNGSIYKIMQIKDWSHFGWKKAFGERIEGK